MCLTPFKKSTGEQVPCGRCPVCKARRVSAWSFRLMQEHKVSSSSLFITLTYDNSHINFTDTLRPTLVKSDLQKFFKRLRKLQCGNKKSPIRYYAAGEYGERTRRPHYHIILFNAKPELIQAAWSIDGKHIGSIHYGQVSEASVGYTLKYICKPYQRRNKGDDRQREFSLMSKGLGSNYLTDRMIEWHKADISERMYCNLKDGKKITMPRYYKDKLYTTKERAFAAAILQQKFREKEFEEFNKCDNYLRNKSEAVKAAFRVAKSKALSLSNNKI